MARMLDGMEALLRGEVNAGRTLGLIECDVMDGSDKLVAHAVSTCMILRAAPAGER